MDDSEIRAGAVVHGSEAEVDSCSSKGVVESGSCGGTCASGVCRRPGQVEPVEKPIVERAKQRPLWWRKRLPCQKLIGVEQAVELELYLQV